MANVAAKIETLDNGTTKVVTWPDDDSAGDPKTGFVAADDVGLPVQLSPWGDVSAQLVGTVGSTVTIAMQGSNDGSTWANLFDVHGIVISLDQAKDEMAQIAEVPLYIRPYCLTEVGTTDCSIIMVMRRSNQSRQ
jgi:hypothetical protein